MSADPQPTLPDPRTADDDEPPNDGRSAPAPAEGGDDSPSRGSGSPAAA